MIYDEKQIKQESPEMREMVNGPCDHQVVLCDISGGIEVPMELRWLSNLLARLKAVIGLKRLKHAETIKLHQFGHSVLANDGFQPPDWPLFYETQHRQCCHQDFFHESVQGSPGKI